MNNNIFNGYAPSYAYTQSYAPTYTSLPSQLPHQGFNQYYQSNMGLVPTPTSQTPIFQTPLTYTPTTCAPLSHPINASSTNAPFNDEQHSDMQPPDKRPNEVLNLYSLVTENNSISLEEIQNNDKILTEKTFKTISDFEKSFKIYCEETCQIFAVTRSSLMDDQTNYHYKVFSCFRHGEIQSKGEQIRNVQSYAASSCPAYIRVIRKGAGPQKGEFFARFKIFIMLIFSFLFLTIFRPVYS